jgi:hypothetical protein
MKRRDLLKSMAALPLGAATAASAQPRNISSSTLGSTPASTPSSAAQPTIGSDGIIPLVPGEITALLGRPGSGKTTVAMSAALELIDAGLSSVWYFSLGDRGVEAAEKTGLGTKQLVNSRAASKFIPNPSIHQAFDGSRPLPLMIISEFFASDLVLPHLQENFSVLGDRPPGLIIYDADCRDYAQFSEREEGTFSSELSERRDECRNHFNAAILVTLSLPSGYDVERDDKQPILADLRPRRGVSSLLDEMFFVHRPALYTGSTPGGIDPLKISRHSRVTARSNSKMLLRDEHTNRLRDLTRVELNQAIRLGV